MQITKIHITEARIEIDYRRPFTRDDKVHFDEFSLKCSEPAEPSLYKAIKDLKDDVLAICELPDDYGLGLKPISVSLRWSEDLFGAVISATKTLKRSNSPLVIHTPFKSKLSDTKDKNPSSMLSPETVLRIEELLKAADRYISGVRGQISLDLKISKKGALN